MVLVKFLRRHLVAAVAIVLAVATGIVLGAGPLSGDTLVPARVLAPSPEQAPVDETADDLAAAVNPTITRGRLDGRTVTVLSTPGATGVDELIADVEGAGGTVSARWKVGQSLVAAGETALVDTLGEQLLEQLGDDVADPDAPAYERMGQLVGAAVATERARAAVPGRTETTIRQSIDAASLLSGDAEEARLAPVVLLVLGEDVEDAVIEGLTTGLGTQARQLVVAAADREGDLASIEELGAATTIDGIDGATGRLAAVLALGATDEDGPGSYGAAGADGVLPLG